MLDPAGMAERFNAPVLKAVFGPRQKGVSLVEVRTEPNGWTHVPNQKVATSWQPIWVTGWLPKVVATTGVWENALMNQEFAQKMSAEIARNRPQPAKQQPPEPQAEAAERERRRKIAVAAYLENQRQLEEERKKRERDANKVDKQSGRNIEAQASPE
jgi:hypothetical protein